MINLLHYYNAFNPPTPPKKLYSILETLSYLFLILFGTLRIDSIIILERSSSL